MVVVRNLQIVDNLKSIEALYSIPIYKLRSTIYCIEEYPQC